MTEIELFCKKDCEEIVSEAETTRNAFKRSQLILSVQLVMGCISSILPQGGNVDTLRALLVNEFVSFFLFHHVNIITGH